MEQAHPHGRAPHRGEGPLALLEGAARRPGTAALVGQDVAVGPRARAARRRAARADRQHNLRDRRGDPLAARDFEQPLAPRAQRFRPGARRAALRVAQCGDARGEDPLHHQPGNRALRLGRGGDPLPCDLRADQQLAQALGLRLHQPLAVAERRHAGARLLR